MNKRFLAKKKKKYLKVLSKRVIIPPNNFKNLKIIPVLNQNQVITTGELYIANKTILKSN